MTDPARLLKSDATEFERFLLGSAALERPTRPQQQRMRRAIGLAQLGIFATSAKAIAGLANHVIVVAVAATTLAGSGSTPRIADHRAIERNSITAMSAERQPAKPMEPAVETSLPEPSANAEPALPESERKGRPVLKPVASSQRLPDLREEIALMDQARTALRSGAPTRALTALEQYRTRYPRGSFGQEARVLRIEALAASGNRTRALAEANAFLAHNPNSPHSERLRRIISSADSGKR